MASQINTICFALLITIYAGNVIDGQMPLSCSTSSSKFFASKTAYRNAQTPTISHQKTIPGCKPLQIYGIYRHGTRYPSVSDVADMIERVPTLRDVIVNASEVGNGTLCPQDKILLKSWKMNFNGSMTNMLHPEGQLEAHAIAKRLRNKFPELFSQSYSPSIYQFRTTDTKRTEDTAKAFIKGIFDTEQGVVLNTKEHEELLRFYKTCKRWESEVDDNDTAIDEYYKFVHGPEMEEVGQRVAQRLGLSAPMSFYNVSILWEMCRFETAWNRYPNGQSPWCNLFSNADLDVMEYSEDILYYWKEGYGYPINYEQSCPVLVDIFQNFNAFHFVRDSHASMHPASLFHFTHSGLLLKLLARLGLFNDSKPLMADDYTQNFNRKWRTSLIDSFGSNIVFVLYNCTQDLSSKEGNLKVMIFVQEQEVLLPNCTSSLCPLETILNTYGNYAKECNLDVLCKANSSVINAVSLYLLTLVIGLFIYNNIA
ncbi:hypothetical protein CHUAL_002980 [Chamberlinius hualienensis]